MYTLKELPFNYQELEPYIDTHTIALHHNKHELNYLNNLNNILNKNNFHYKYSKEELYNHLDIFPQEDINDIIFNLGGVVNHELYWQSINPKNRTLPQGKLLKKINETYGSYDKFKEEFTSNALNIKGSGYTNLALDQNNNLIILNTTNQLSPYLYNYIPLFNIDLWEHAYYLNYKNNKKEYLDNIFEIANFNYANKILETRK